MGVHTEVSRGKDIMSSPDTQMVQKRIAHTRMYM